MPPSLLRHTIVGLVIGAALFGLVPLVRLWATGELVPDAAQPLAWFALLGAVIGGLAGPLVGRAWERFRSQEER